jgi:hypothetical protein
VPRQIINSEYDLDEITMRMNFPCVISMSNPTLQGKKSLVKEYALAEESRIRSIMKANCVKSAS